MSGVISKDNAEHKGPDDLEFLVVSAPHAHGDRVIDPESIRSKRGGSSGRQA